MVAVLPSDMGGYEYVDPHSGKKIKVNGAEEKKLSDEALCFYRPLPQRELKLRDLFRYMMECLTARDLVSFGFAALAITLVGLLMPRLNYILMGTVVEFGSSQLLVAVVSFLFFATVGSLLFNIIRNLLLNRILRVLLSAQKTMNKNGSMVVTHVKPEIMDIFDVTGFVDIMNIEE